MTKNNIATKEENIQQSQQDTFKLKVYAPFKVYYDGNAKSVSAVNNTGPFDILVNHHNFITLLNPCDVVIREEGKEKSPMIIQISKGIMQIHDNDVIIFLDV